MVKSKMLCEKEIIVESIYSTERFFIIDLCSILNKKDLIDVMIEKHCMSKEYLERAYSIEGYAFMEEYYSKLVEAHVVLCYMRSELKKLLKEEDKRHCVKSFINIPISKPLI